MNTNPFKVDYSNLSEVISFTKRFGKGLTVYKDPNRPNYNITHTSRKDLYQQDWIKFQS